MRLCWISVLAGSSTLWTSTEAGPRSPPACFCSLSSVGRCSRLGRPSSLAMTASVSRPSSFMDDGEASRQNNSNSNNNDQRRFSGKRTLYDVLQAPPTATREELKAQYVKLAKQSHPDAVFSNGGIQEGAVDFAEIAAAWETLGDRDKRRKYDRTLLADTIKDDVQRAAAKVGQKAGPQVLNLFEKVALPIIRKTSVTTNAAFSALVQDDVKEKTGQDEASSPGRRTMRRNNAAANTTPGSVKKKPKGDIFQPLSSAIKAGREAALEVDRQEALAKARELDERAQREYEAAQTLALNAQNVAYERRRLLVHTPESKLTSEEAASILKEFKKLKRQKREREGILTLSGEDDDEEEEEDFDDQYSGGPISPLDRMFSKRRASEKIERLRLLEEDCRESGERLKKAEVDYMSRRDALVMASNRVDAAMEAEERAREALEHAQTVLANCQAVLSDSANELTILEQLWDRRAKESEHLKQNLISQQERVRKSLQTKARMSGMELDAAQLASVDAAQALEGMKREEAILTAQSAKHERLSKLLSSKAEQLRRKAASKK